MTRSTDAAQQPPRVASALREFAPVIGGVIAYLGVVGTFAAVRHATFQTQAWDLGLFVQSVWNTTQGRIFENSLEGAGHLRTHFSPFLFVLVPGYALARSPYTLLWLQSIALAAAALPFYALASARLGRASALGVTAAYLLYPWLHAVNLFDVHVEPFAVPVIFAAFLAIERKRHVVAAALLLAAALTKESAALVVVFVGLALLARRDTRRFGLVVALSAGVLFAGISSYLMSGRGGELFRLFYGHLGETPAAVVANAAHHPGTFLGHVLAPERLAYVARLLAPVAFLPLFAPLVLLPAVPILAQNLMSRLPNQISNQYQYDILIIPFLFLALIEALVWARSRSERLAGALRWAVVIASVALYATLSPARPAMLARIPKMLEDRSNGADSLIARVPNGASLAVSTHLAPHLAERRELYLLGTEPHPVDAVAIDATEYFPFDTEQAFRSYVDALVASRRYTTESFAGRYVLMLRRP